MQLDNPEHPLDDDIRLGRRRFLLSTALASFTTYALLREARAVESIRGKRISPVTWIRRQEELAIGLREGSVSQRAWHEEVNRMATEVDISELMAEVRRGQSRVGTPFMRDPVKRSIRFVDANGQPMALSYAVAMFSFGPQSVITPHAHRFMASAHLVVEGRVRIRTFDRIADEAEGMRIRPTADHVGSVGSMAAMTTQKDNVHWFTPATPTAATFDVIVDALEAGQERYLIQPVDPVAGRMDADGTLVAPLLTFEESMRRYTAEM